MSPYVLLVFAFIAWLFRSRDARSTPPPPWPPRRSGPASAEEDRRLRFRRGLGVAGIYREVLRVVLARNRRFVGTVVCLALPVSALWLAHAVLVARLLDAWACRWFASLLLLARLEAACLWALLIVSAATAASFAISVASFYCCVDDDRALVWRLIEEGRCIRLVENLLRALDFVLLYSAAAGAVVFGLPWLVALALPGAPALDLSDARDWYIAGLLYVGADWQLAAVVSVLEQDEHARMCFSRSSALLAGNFCAAAAVFTFLVNCLELVQAAFGSLVLRDRMGFGFGLRVATTLATLAAVCAVVVVALVAHSFFYFACKAYHGEAIDLGLREHQLLDANNNGEY